MESVKERQSLAEIIIGMKRRRNTFHSADDLDVRSISSRPSIPGPRVPGWVKENENSAPLPNNSKYYKVSITGEPDPECREMKNVAEFTRRALLWRQKLVWTASEENRDHTKYSLRDPPSFVLPSVEKTLEKIKQRRNDDADASADVKEQAAEPVPRFAYEMVDGVMQVKWYTGAKRVIQDNENTNKNSNSNTASAADGDDERDQTTKSENKHNSNSNSREPESEREKVDLDTYEPTNFAKDVNDDEDEFELIKAPSRDVFSQALMEVMGAIAYGPMKTFAYSRLKILEARFNLHGLLNREAEAAESKDVPHRDFYNVRKVDNHVHHSACMNQKHLLRFIKHTLKTDKDTVVVTRDGKDLTLKEVFEDLGLSSYDLTIDTLDMRAGTTFQRFDKFNNKYNPLGEKGLREIFLKYNNRVGGKYLAQVTQQVFEDLELNKYQFAEYRVSIYGRNSGEWAKLARWVVDHNLFHPNVKWMIQIPRLYAVYKKNKLITSFQDMLDNIFEPLFEITMNPEKDPKLSCFLEQLVGFDSVDDESQREHQFQEDDPIPSQYTGAVDPNYAYFGYYMYANLYALNTLRARLGMSTFAYRPHGGEAGDIQHMAACFLFARSVNHGIMLKHSPALQYLYYLSQTGLSVSPLSNNLLFLEYSKNPFPRFFNRGLNVTLSTDDPLMIHVTKEPLVEEYSVAAQVWKLTSVDMCEIARNSVLQSGFENRCKVHWLGNGYWKRCAETGNEVVCSNVPSVRINFRLDLLREEYGFLSTFLPSTKTMDISLCDTL